MPKLNTNRHDDLQDRHGRTLADMLNEPEKPFDAVLDLSICGGQQRSVQDSETHQAQIPLAGESEARLPIDDFFSSEPPHGTKRSRQAVDVATQLSMQRHGWKQTGEKSPYRTFEHRWPHMRDRAEGRNHGVRGK